MTFVDTYVPATKHELPVALGSLSTLPRELRDQVYHFVFLEIRLNIRFRHSDYSIKAEYHPSGDGWSVQYSGDLPGWMLVSQQVLWEALQQYHRNATFSVQGLSAFAGVHQAETAIESKHLSLSKIACLKVGPFANRSRIQVSTQEKAGTVLVNLNSISAELVTSLGHIMHPWTSLRCLDLCFSHDPRQPLYDDCEDLIQIQAGKLASYKTLSFNLQKLEITLCKRWPSGNFQLSLAETNSDQKAHNEVKSQLRKLAMDLVEPLGGEQIEMLGATTNGCFHDLSGRFLNCECPVFRPLHITTTTARYRRFLKY